MHKLTGTRALAWALGLLTVACSGSSPPRPDAAPGDTSLPIDAPVVPTDAAADVATDTAVAALAAPPAISGGTLLVLHDGSAAVASDPDRDQIYVVDLAHHTLRATLTLRPQDEPGRLIEDGAGRVHVVLRGGGALVTLDPRSGKLLAERAICPAPRGLAYDGARDLVHVACAGDELVSIAPLGMTPTRTLHLDRDLRDVVVRGDRLLVSTFRTAELLVVSETGITQRLRPPARTAVSSPSGGGQASAAVAWRLVAGPGPQVLELHQRGLDEMLGTQPNAYAPRGPTCAGIVESTVSAYVEGDGTARIRSGRALGNAVLAVDLALSPDGRKLAVVAAGNGANASQIVVYDTDDVTAEGDPNNPGCTPPQGGHHGDVDGGRRPCDGDGGAGCIDEPDAGAPADGADAAGGAADAEEPIEYRPPNGQLVAAAFTPGGDLIVQSREPATLQILTQQAAPIVLSPESRADRGHQIFHSATSGNLACASCHPEGGEDGRVWQFVGLGPRRTQSLRGGIMDTAPFHWNGDMPSFGTLVHNVFEGRMAGPRLDSPSQAALASWLDQDRTIKPSAWHDAAAASRGQALFESPSVACSTCHAGPDHTNGATVEVGTGGLFQVPQLHGVAFHAPYLHDGCAATLLERFTKCGTGDRHGLTAHLTANEIDDIIAYLETF